MKRKGMYIEASGNPKNSQSWQAGTKGHNIPPSRNSQGLQNMEYICKCSQNLEKLTASDKWHEHLEM
jgi:hypothetical protein